MEILKHIYIKKFYSAVKFSEGVRDDRLVQAKLKFNRPVHEDSAVNGAVVDWCNRVGLKISTYDVRKMRYPAVLEAVTA